MSNQDQVLIRLEGDTNVAAAFADLRYYLPKFAMRAAVRKAAQFLEEFVREAAPVATGRSVAVRLPGQLRSNIDVKAKGTTQTQRARVVVSTIGSANNPRNSFYWRFLEEGFHTRSGEARKFPFIAAVVERQGQYAAQVLVDACDAAIKRAESKARSEGVQVRLRSVGEGS